MTDAKPEKRIAVDHVILVCNGCQKERRFNFQEPLIGADALIAWMKTIPTACGCGAGTCDVKAHLMEEQ